MSSLYCVTYFIFPLIKGNTFFSKRKNPITTPIIKAIINAIDICINVPPKRIMLPTIKRRLNSLPNVLEITIYSGFLNAISVLPTIWIKVQNGILIANTIKGKGIISIENNPAWHHKAPSKEEMKKFKLELKIWEKFFQTLQKI